MTIADWIVQPVWEGTSLKVMARLVGKTNAVTDILQANIASITYRVVVDGTTEVIASTALTVADVIFDTLQTSDAAWTKDSTGYNFMTIFPPTHFPTGATTIYIFVTITDTSAPTAIVGGFGVQVPVRETYSDTPA